MFSASTSSYTNHLVPVHSSKVADETMPRPNPPPTPGSSSDIRAKEGGYTAPLISLPPTAFPELDRASTTSSASSASGSDSSYRPISPSSSAEVSRKRPASQSSSVVTKDDFALPPPPTRSRKIIHMKPKDSGILEHPSLASEATQANRTQNTSQTPGKRKQGAVNTAVGKKIARKTAHSLIERRRRSKMNEEFGVMKDMIPACKGQEMHKLAILQAGIEYVRYLEQCVTDLKAQSTSRQKDHAPTSSVRSRQQTADQDEDEEMDDSDDEETTSTPIPTAHHQSGSGVSLPSLSEITTASTSPSILDAGARRHYSSSSASQANYSPYFHSNQTSPSFGPQLSHISSMPTSAGGSRDTFVLGSPSLNPMDSARRATGVSQEAHEPPAKRHPASSRAVRSDQELDQEATTALLMLNTDRRSWQPFRGSRDGETARANSGMSVRDLLSG